MPYASRTGALRALCITHGLRSTNGDNAPSMRVGDEMTIEPAELVAGGAALAKIDGFPLFVANVYPGDMARVRIVEMKKGFGRAELVRIERPSAQRRTLPCPIAAECGGCDWTELRLDAQPLAAARRRRSDRLLRDRDPSRGAARSGM